MIVDCPKCRGTGFLSLQQESFMDPACDMCLGYKRVNTERVCGCGRPAVQVIEKKLICNAKACYDKAKGVAPKAHEAYVC